MRLKAGRHLATQAADATQVAEHGTEQQQVLNQQILQSLLVHVITFNNHEQNEEARMVEQTENE